MHVHACMIMTLYDDALLTFVVVDSDALQLLTLLAVDSGCGCKVQV